MIDRAGDTASDVYSPQLRTALVLTGTGTAGAYHAGVLRALDEAGVKLDVVAGRGIGVIGAVFAAIDGAQRLWSDKGFWRSPGVAALYPWRTIPLVAGWALIAALAVVVVPIVAMALGLVVFPIDFLLKMIGGVGAPDLAGAYVRFAESAFAPDALPTWLPRLALLVVAGAGVAAAADGWTHRGRRTRDAVWWAALRAPLSSQPAIDHCWSVMWDLVRGAAALTAPPPGELARRYTDMLAENLGQPGFRELFVTVHDIDAHRDLVFALVAGGRARDLVRRSTSSAAELRRAEVFDLSGVAREYLADAVAAALAIPMATDWHTVTFAPDSYWRGETHRLCDRPAGLIRLVDELIDAGVRQIVLVSSAAESDGPHALEASRLDVRGRLGEYLESSEAAVVRDATTTTAGVRIFTIRPAHNPVGPFDFSGGYDDRSQRAQPLTELMTQGYQDAYHQFIEPVVGASGEKVGVQ
jgi:hypothetical protein